MCLTYLFSSRREELESIERPSRLFELFRKLHTGPTEVEESEENRETVTRYKLQTSDQASRRNERRHLIRGRESDSPTTQRVNTLKHRIPRVCQPNAATSPGANTLIHATLFLLTLNYTSHGQPDIPYDRCLIRHLEAHKNRVARRPKRW
jgi:hypothetical protein